MSLSNINSIMQDWQNFTDDLLVEIGKDAQFIFDVDSNLQESTFNMTGSPSHTNLLPFGGKSYPHETVGYDNSGNPVLECVNNAFAIFKGALDAGHPFNFYTFVVTTLENDPLLKRIDLLNDNDTSVTVGENGDFQTIEELLVWMNDVHEDLHFELLQPYSGDLDATLLPDITIQIDRGDSSFIPGDISCNTKIDIKKGELSKSFKCRLYGNPKELDRNEISVSTNTNLYKMITKQVYIPDITRCREVLLDTTEKRIRLKLLRGPVPYGLGEYHNSMSFWQEIS